MLVSILLVDKADTFRAPIAKFILKKILKDKNLTSYFFVDTAALHGEHEGKDLTDDAKRELKQNQVPFYLHESKRVKNSDYEKYDFIVTMEDSQIKELINLFGGDNDMKIRKLLDFAYDSHDIEYPKNGDFSGCFADLQIGCQALLDDILEK